MNLNDYYCHDCRDWQAARRTSGKGRECLTCGHQIQCDDCGAGWHDDHVCYTPPITPDGLENEIKDLVYNGFTREEAAAQVADANGGGDGFRERLLSLLPEGPLPGEGPMDKGLEIDAGIYSAAVAAVRRRRR